MSYDKLVAALRCKGLSKKCDSCGYGYHISPDSECNDACHFEQIVEDAAAEIEDLQAQLPKRGEWVRVENEESYHYECSRCGERPLYSRYGDVVLSKVCPNCWADMRKMEVQE